MKETTFIYIMDEGAVGKGCDFSHLSRELLLELGVRAAQRLYPLVRGINGREWALCTIPHLVLHSGGRVELGTGSSGFDAGLLCRVRNSFVFDTGGIPRLE